MFETIGFLVFYLVQPLKLFMHTANIMMYKCTLHSEQCNNACMQWSTDISQIFDNS